MDELDPKVAEALFGDSDIRIADSVYTEIERRVDEADDRGLTARWEFGKTALEECGDRRKLPDGRLDELARLIRKPKQSLEGARREVQRRMQFARIFSTEAELRHAVTQFGSWHEIVNKVLPTRGPLRNIPLTLDDPR